MVTKIRPDAPPSSPDNTPGSFSSQNITSERILSFSQLEYGLSPRGSAKTRNEKDAQGVTRPRISDRMGLLWAVKQEKEYA